MLRTRTSLLALFALTLSLAVAAVAAAQSTVTVEVRTASGAPGEARVTLTSSTGGPPHSCQTSGGRCQLTGVPAGRYVVSAASPTGGQSPIPRRVMIGGRTTTVHVTLR